jgi:NhaA family Na+:H+ antiporter
MTLFFFVVGLEIRRELVLGELRDLRVAALPIAAAFGGMLVPAAIYLALQLGEPGERGWGVVMATDIAFVVGCLAVLGERVPHSLRIFVLSLAIIDDIGAVLVIALAYSANLDLQMIGLGILGVSTVLALRRLGVRSVPVYYLAGILTWAAVDRTGIHPTILGVVLGLLTPAHPWVGERRLQAIMGRVSEYLQGARWEETSNKSEKVDLVRSVAFAARETLSPLERLEASLHPWVSFLILPLFAFANAGVPLSVAGFGSPVALAVIAGLMLGKPIGIFAASWLAVQLGVAARPTDVRWPLIAAAGVLCGIGFTMAIFIANLAFEVGLLASASLGILAASLGSALLGLALLAASLRFGRTP